MPKLSDDKMAIGFVALVFIWTLVVLPMRPWEHWTADDVIAAFTVVLAGSTILLWYVTRQGIQAQARDTEILQRAYVTVEPMGIASFKDGAKSLAHIDIRNAGHLPARAVKWVIKDKFSEDDRLNDFPVDEEDAEGENTVPPGGAMRQGGGPINLDDEVWSKRDKLYLYVWGAAFYQDGFGNPRVTRFCHRYNCANIEIVAEGTVSMRVISHKYARYHRYGNDAD